MPGGERGTAKGGKVPREPKVYTSRMSFLLTVGFLKVGNQPTTATGNANARCGKCKPCTSFEPSVPFLPQVGGGDNRKIRL